MLRHQAAPSPGAGLPEESGSKALSLTRFPLSSAAPIVKKAVEGAIEFVKKYLAREVMRWSDGQKWLSEGGP